MLAYCHIVSSIAICFVFCTQLNGSKYSYITLQWFLWDSCGIGVHVNADKTEYMCFNTKSWHLYIKWRFSEAAFHIRKITFNMRLAKPWTDIDIMSIIWRSKLSDRIKRNFFQAAVVSILLYGCTMWTLTEHIEKKLDNNCTKCNESYWTNPGTNIPRNSSSTATYLLSRKSSK